MKEIQTTITINAPSERVWEVLTDFENHPTWNPFIKAISGDKQAGGKLIVFLQPPGGSGMTFKPSILVFDEKKEFRWKGKLFVPGIFDGEHYFLLQDKGDNTTKFTHGEKFTGILTGFVGSVLDKTKEGFDLMNKALKAECERKV